MFFGFVVKPTRFHAIFHLSGKCFLQPPGSSEYTSPEVSWTAPKVVGRAQRFSVRSETDIVSATEGKNNVLRELRVVDIVFDQDHCRVYQVGDLFS